jgi:hypothetical protein
MSVSGQPPAGTHTRIAQARLRADDRAERLADDADALEIEPAREHVVRVGTIERLELVERDDDVPVGHELLDLEGLDLSVAPLDAHQHDQHRVGARVLRGGREFDGVGADGSERTQRRARDAEELREGWPHRVRVGDVGGSRRRHRVLGRVPDLRHELSAGVRIVGENLDMMVVDPVAGGRADPTLPRRTRKRQSRAVVDVNHLAAGR